MFRDLDRAPRGARQHPVVHPGRPPSSSTGTTGSSSSTRSSARSSPIRPPKGGYYWEVIRGTRFTELVRRVKEGRTKASDEVVLKDRSFLCGGGVPAVAGARRRHHPRPQRDPGRRADEEGPRPQRLARAPDAAHGHQGIRRGPRRERAGRGQGLSRDHRPQHRPDDRHRPGPDDPRRDGGPERKARVRRTST